MDTVESTKGDSVLLTLLWRQSNFMLAYKLDSKDSDSVSNFFTGTNFYTRASTSARQIGVHSRNEKLIKQGLNECGDFADVEKVYSARAHFHL